LKTSVINAGHEGQWKISKTIYAWPSLTS
jgi:hypothetical protein